MKHDVLLAFAIGFGLFLAVDISIYYMGVSKRALYDQAIAECEREYPHKKCKVIGVNINE